MESESTFSSQTGLFQSHVRTLLQERQRLKKELSQVEQQLETHFTTMKQYMATHGYKKIDLQEFRLTYTYPRRFYRMNRPVTELATKFPEFFDEEIGYDRLRISNRSSVQDELVPVEEFDPETQKAGLKLIVERARLTDNVSYPDDDDDEEEWI